MTLGSDIAAALPGLRAEAISRMSETVTVGTFSDGVDPETGDPVRTPDDARYSGPARVRYGSITASGTASSAEQVGQAFVVQAPYLSVPWGSPRLYEGDEVLVDESASDPLLIGRVYQIAGNAAIGQVTAHRYPLTELT